MDKAKEAERRSLVHRLRAFRRASMRRNYFSVEERIIPCCATCEYNNEGKCTACPAPGFFSYHRYGHEIEDPEDLCILWGASLSAFQRALSFQRTPPPSDLSVECAGDREGPPHAHAAKIPGNGNSKAERPKAMK